MEEIFFSFIRKEISFKTSAAQKLKVQLAHDYHNSNHWQKRIYTGSLFPLN